jgi:uncharacterized membrane protein YphA (DoxX/SURF4 family)
MSRIEADNQVALRARDWWAALVLNKHIVLIFRLLLGGIFLLGSFAKLVNIERYSVEAVYKFGILPMGFARLFGLALPFIELLCGLGLLLGILIRLSALGSALMSIAFFIAKAVVIAQGRNIDCGCFGAFIGLLLSESILMDVPMLFFALVVMRAPDQTVHWAAIGMFIPSTLKEKFKLLW